MRLLVVSGRSGSGKSSALHLLEDEGYTCIDNIPVSLTPGLIDYISQQKEQRFAIGIDARNLDGDLSPLSDMLEKSSLTRDEYKVIYLDTHKDVLLTRFSETRRKHPLSSDTVDLNEALELEREILAPMVAIADTIIDTSAMSLHELRSTVRRIVVGKQSKGLALRFTSFGFKFGVPTDADFIFDVRSLPNPHWERSLRLKTGLDPEVIDYLGKQPAVQEMMDDIYHFVIKWLPSFQDNNRSYLTIGIGCTGGMHRSVYMSECLAARVKQSYANVLVRHRQVKGKRPK